MKVLYQGNRDSNSKLDPYVGTDLWIKVLYQPLGLDWYVRVHGAYVIRGKLLYRVNAVADNTLKQFADLHDTMYIDLHAYMTQIISVWADQIQLRTPIECYTTAEFAATFIDRYS